MDIKEIKTKAVEFYSNPDNYASYGDDLKSADSLFANIYNELPQRTYIMLFDEEKGFYFSPYYNSKVNKTLPVGEIIEYNNFMSAFQKNLSSENIDFVISTLKSDDTFVFTTIGFIILDIETSTGNVKKIMMHPLTDTDNNVTALAKPILNAIATKKNPEMEKNHYKIAYVDEGMIDTLESEFDDWDTDIEKNYNDDVPYKEINNEIAENKSSLIMLCGDPGTGKSSLIKSIVNENLDKEFIYVDPSLMTSLSNGQFLSFLNDHRGSVFILEDCEKALADRTKGGNDSTNTILNITDGIVAESLKCKFICTINCPLDQIDPALLRDGRLSILYEFKKLSLEKTKVIYPEATKEMTLAEAYNATHKNDFRTQTKRKIGF